MELYFLHCKAVMDKQLLLICALTFIIHIIGSLASRAHRRHPHATHHRLAGTVQHPDAAVAHLELFPGTLPCQARRDRHRPARCRQRPAARLPLAAVVRQPGDDNRRHTDPHLPARLLPRRRPLPGAKLLLHAVFKGGQSYLKTSARPAQARQRHWPAPTIGRLRLHDGHGRHRHGAVDDRRLRRALRWRAGPERARHLQHTFIDHQRRRHHHHHHDGRLHRPAHVWHDG